MEAGGVYGRSLCNGKLQWPELLGMSGCEAAAIIARENSNVQPIVLPQNGFGDLAYRCDRVRVLIDHTGRVSRTPVVG